MAKIKVSDFVAEFLRVQGLTHVFDLAGGMIVNLEDSISRVKGIQCFPMHHEQAAGFAAEGYARVSQNLGAAMATSGPGATNLITAIGSCYFDSIPTIFLTGQVDVKLVRKHAGIRQNGFQETDVVTIAQSITKYSKFVTVSDDILYELEKAVFIARHGRPGPVLLDLPYNVQTSEVEPGSLRRFIGSAEHAKFLQKNRLETKIGSKVKQLKELLKKSQRPIIVAGHGVRLSGTMGELEKFAARNNIPVVCSLLGLDSLPGSDKKFVGFIGSFGNRESNMALANSDLVLALGSRLDIRQTGVPWLFGKNSTIVHVDIDPHSINNEIKSQLSFAMGLPEFFSAITGLTTPAKKNWLGFIQAVKKEFQKQSIYPKGTVDPNSFISELSRHTPDGAVIVSDVGQNQMWLAQSWVVKKNQRLVFSGGMGAMGYSLPAAIGAYCARPSKNLIVICGDGGLQINIQEMETVSRSKIPLKIFILNNKSLGMVRDSQHLYFKKNFQSTIVGYGCPDLKKISAAYNFSYVAIKSLAQNDDRIKKILGMSGPVLIEVNIDQFFPLEPKVVFGKPLDDQQPYLSEQKKQILEQLKQKFLNYAPTVPGHTRP